jgi:hypothetical protein
LDATIGSLIGLSFTLIRSFKKHLVQVQWVKHHGFTFFLSGGREGGVFLVENLAKGITFNILI